MLRRVVVLAVASPFVVLTIAWAAVLFGPRRLSERLPTIAWLGGAPPSWRVPPVATPGWDGLLQTYEWGAYHQFAGENLGSGAFIPFGRFGVAAGWPFIAFTASWTTAELAPGGASLADGIAVPIARVGTDSNYAFTETRLPVTPHWRGLLADSVVVGASIAVLSRLVATVRRRLRPKNRCAGCGHRLHPCQIACPECGSATGTT